MPRDVEAVLASCTLLRHVRGPARQRLLDIARRRRFVRGDRVFDQGEPCPGIYVVDAGLVRVYKIAPNGKEHVLHLVSPGATFAEVAAIGGFPCPAHAEALADTECLLLPTDLLVEALAEDHDLCLQLMQGLTGWVRHLVGLLEDITLRDAVGRVSRHLVQAADPELRVALPAAKKHLASHLNLTSETLSRTLSRLIEAGLVVEHGGNRVELRDRAQLSAISEGRYPQL